MIYQFMLTTENLWGKIFIVGALMSKFPNVNLICNLQPSFAVFHSFLNQLSLGVFTMLSMHTMQQNTSTARREG